MSAQFQWSNLNPVCEPAQIASQQILSWFTNWVQVAPSLSTIFFSYHLQHCQSSPENQTLQQNLEAHSQNELSLYLLKSVIIVSEFSRF
jgi:hypothetical protein